VTTTENAVEADLDAIATSWLDEFQAVLRDGASAATQDLFHADSWWRDLLAFTWDLRTAHGRDAIAAFISSGADLGLTSVELLGAASLVEAGDTPWIQAMFEFQTNSARGQGVLRLVNRDGAWKAWTLLTAVDALVGHEEMTGARRPHGGAQGSDRTVRNWSETRKRDQEFVDAEPTVLVVGAGHAGLGLAARLGTLGLQTLLIDRNERIGDGWRNRYDSLVLHDPVWYDHLPYLPFPANWPIYTPKDKLADWLESYAHTMELNVWTGTALIDSSYDEKVGEWTVTLKRADGTRRTVRPRHLVLATGISGTEPNVPQIEGQDQFTGTACHSKDFPRGVEFAGRKAVVVGSCNSGHDIAQELFEKGAEVTMIQRSPTYVVSVAGSGIAMAGLYDETGPPTEVADLIGASFPFKAVPEMHQATTAAMAEFDKEILEALKRAGFLLSSGIDGTGALQLFLQKGGGYYINVGASELIAEGKIGIRSGVEVQRFTPNALELSDGSRVEADVVVFATGYKGMIETARRLLGDDVAEQCTPVWGLDDEGELRGVWRRTGHEGLWFMGGNLAMARFYGKFLALQIKAIEIGVLDPRSDGEHPTSD
jgi:putative flavoprotein involved in K+ transport